MFCNYNISIKYSLIIYRPQNKVNFLLIIDCYYDKVMVHLSIRLLKSFVIFVFMFQIIAFQLFLLKAYVSLDTKLYLLYFLKYYDCSIY